MYRKCLQMGRFPELNSMLFPLTELPMNFYCASERYGTKTLHYFIISLQETWGRQCNGIVFVSNTTDSKLPVIIVHRNESWHTLWIKTREAFQWIYNNVLVSHRIFLVSFKVRRILPYVQRCAVSDQKLGTQQRFRD